LMAPDLVAEFVTAFTAEWNRLAGAAVADRDGITRDLAVTERKLKGLIDAIADGFRGPGLQEQLDALEARKVSLTAKLEAPAPTVPRLHPNLAEIYLAKVQTMQDALAANPSGTAALEAARALIDRVEVTPAATTPGYEVELIGELATMLRFGMGREAPSGAADRALFARSVKVVAGARNRRSHHSTVPI
jgi:site-specific DNA recombinase